MTRLQTPCVIMAGGKSSRMGKDKALLPFGNFKTLTQFQLDRLSFFFESLHVSTKTRDKFDFNASFIEDVKTYQQHSPLVALLSVLRHFNEPVFVLSVDTPFVTRDVFEKLYEAMRTSNADAIIARSPSMSHQLCAIYSPKITDKIETMLNTNEHKIRILLEKINTVFVDFDGENVFFNLNRPEDYEVARKKLG
ncbi:MAG: molybdenum cofactor guanylyltransferase MobA [Sulfurospirillaceae bacterium]|nr:molybdenum cofactor guanylyltransferase MobA [Sulfurospirillaceae bacterium]MDD3462500.1 molybdenum cofactor guanylyltransferase MobA [Sulfurospirillaceae bacterium]